MTERPVGRGEGDEELRDVEVRDPRLGAVEDELVALAAVGGVHPGDVTARAGLGDAGGAEDPALGQRLQPPLLLLGVAVGLDAAADQAGRHRHERAEDLAGLGDLLDQLGEGHVVEAEATLLLADHAAEEAERTHLVEQLTRDALGLVVRLDQRRDLGRRELPGQVDDRAAIVGFFGRHGDRFGLRLRRCHARSGVGRVAVGASETPNRAFTRMG